MDANIPEGFSLEQAPQQALAAAPGSLPPGFEVEPPTPPSGMGGAIQAGVEGALGPIAGPGVGLPGTAGLMKSGLGIGSNEGIRQRAEEHPIAHGIGELGSLVAGPEGAGLEGAGIGALEALGLRAPTTFAAKVGSSAVKNAAEFAAYNGFDEVTKTIHDDPNAGAESFLSNVGLGAALGGAGGAAFSGLLSPLWKATKGSELAGKMSALISHLGGTEESVAAKDGINGLTRANELEQQTGVPIPEQLKPVINDTPGAMEQHSKLNQTDNTVFGRKYQALIAEHNDALTNKAVESLGKDASVIDDLPKVDKYTTGRNAGESLIADLEPEVKAIQGRYDQTHEEFKGSPLWKEDQRVIADQIATLATENGWHKAESDAQKNLASRTIGKMSEQQTIEDLSKFITNLTNSHPYGSDTYYPAKQIKDIIRSNQERIIGENIARSGGDAAGKVAEYSQLRQDYHQLMNKIDGLNEHLHVGKYSGPDSFLQALKEMSTTNGEGVLNRLSGKNKADVLEQLKQFPKTLAAIKDYHVNNLLESAVAKATPGNRLNINNLMKNINGLSPQLQELIANPQQHRVLQGIEQTVDALKDPTHNFSNTARTVAKQLADSPSTLSFIAAMMGHAGAGALGYIGKLGFTEGKDAVRYGLLKFLGSEKKVSAEGLKASVNFIHNAQVGAKRLETAAENVFKPGALVLLPSMKPNVAQLEKLDKLVASNDPQTDNKMMASQSNNPLGHYMPDHQSALSQASLQSIQYLRTLKPKPTQNNPLDTPFEPTTAQTARYNRALEIAQSPAVVLQRVKDGTVSATDVKDLQSMYPAVYKHLSQKLTNEMISHKSEETPLPYKTRMGMSLFLGQPMDTSMTPVSIQTIQMTHAPKQPPQSKDSQGLPKMGKKGTSTLGKSSKSYKTTSQAAESDRSDRD